MDFLGVKQIIVVILRSLMTLILFYCYMLIMEANIYDIDKKKKVLEEFAWKD